MAFLPVCNHCLFNIKDKQGYLMSCGHFLCLGEFFFSFNSAKLDGAQPPSLPQNSNFEKLHTECFGAETLALHCDNWRSKVTLCTLGVSPNEPRTVVLSPTAGRLSVSTMFGFAGQRDDLVQVPCGRCMIRKVNTYKPADTLL